MRIFPGINILIVENGTGKTQQHLGFKTVEFVAYHLPSNADEKLRKIDRKGGVGGVEHNVL